MANYALRPDGTSSFAELQAATDRKDSVALTYFAFDLLFLDGEYWRVMPFQPMRRRRPRSPQFLRQSAGG
jgi:bifunctional non-homologous end joining protein LigD